MQNGALKLMPRFLLKILEVEIMWRKLFLTCLFLLLLFAPAHAAEKIYTIPIDNCPILGPKDAPITIVEFLDFQ